MKETRVIHSDFTTHSDKLNDLIVNFDTIGEEFGNQDRNTIKVFDLEDRSINVKSFKIPNIFNQIAYRFLRKSKAQRSYEYANKLTNLGIGTPQPIAYFEFKTPFLFKRSFYVSIHQDCDITYRELTKDFNYPNHEAILRAFTCFTFNLHENNILFLDHSPGNTLIKHTDEGYEFFLVDLNRMQFKPLSFEERIQNFARLTTHQSMVEVMSDEYAKLMNEDYKKTFNLMWKLTQEFQEKFHRKRRLKKKLKFWKK